MTNVELALLAQAKVILDKHLDVEGTEEGLRKPVRTKRLVNRRDLTVSGAPDLAPLPQTGPLTF
jgi:hypothetical protein